MGRIFLIRHGQASVLSDNYDKLSEIGKKQSKVLGKYFLKDKIQVQNIYSGPLKRQIGTAKRALRKPLNNGFNIEIINQLREHEGFQIIKSVLPELIVNDQEIRQMASMETEKKADRIKNYLKIYEVLSTRWIHDELDFDDSKFESWPKFKERVSEGIEIVLKRSKKGRTQAVFSSGGPIAVSIGNILRLSDEKMLHLSWVINNTSISELIFSKNRISLKSFNTIPHIKEEELITIV